MIAVDTNILVYALQSTSPNHSVALAKLEALEQGPSKWGIPQACMAEFLCVATNPVQLQKEVLTIDEAMDEFEEFTSRNNARILLPMKNFVAIYNRLLGESRAFAGKVFDVQIAAICIEHGVTRLITEDRSFPQVAGLKLERLPTTYKRGLPAPQWICERQAYIHNRNSSNLQVLAEKASSENSLHTDIS